MCGSVVESGGVRCGSGADVWSGLGVLVRSGGRGQVWGGMVRCVECGQECEGVGQRLS